MKNTQTHTLKLQDLTYKLKLKLFYRNKFALPPWNLNEIKFKMPVNMTKFQTTTFLKIILKQHSKYLTKN